MLLYNCGVKLEFKYIYYIIISIMEYIIYIIACLSIAYCQKIIKTQYLSSFTKFTHLRSSQVLTSDGDWGLGIGDWGLGPSPIPNPQSPIPNPPSNKLIFIITKNNCKHILSFCIW